MPSSQRRRASRLFVTSALTLLALGAGGCFVRPPTPPMPAPRAPGMPSKEYGPE
jgi:hypothetical protein